MKKVCQRMKINHPQNHEEKHTGSSRSVFDFPPNQNGTDAFYSMARCSDEDCMNRFFEPP
ncbi:hypothetical protein HanRHA438_Chr10g0436751 [Helianthus annuus]|nr:hypothetical protein HanRHA438_Chr10g0436751 [Helianthus annuus]